MMGSYWTVLRRITGEVYPYWPQLLGIFALSLLSTPLALLAPLPMKIVIDHVLGSQSLPALLADLLPEGIATSRGDLLVVAAGMVVTIALLNQSRGFAAWVLQTWSGERMVFAFRTRMFAHAQRLSLAYHDAKGTSDSAFRIQYDAPALQHVMVNGVIPLLSSFSQLAGMIWVTVLLDWKLALIALAVSPVMFVLIQIFSVRLRKGWEHVTLLDSSANAIVQEVLSSLRVVKAFAREDYEHMRYQNKSYGFMKEQVRVSMIQGLFDLTIVFTIAAGTGVTLYVGVLHIESGQLTLGNLVLLLAYVAQLHDPLQVMSKKLTDLQASMVSARRAFTLLDQQPDVNDRLNALPLARASGHVRFEKVSFGYAPGSFVLQDVSLDAKPGMRVGIQGETGAGKSTLLSLLIRFYDVSEGRILLDGEDIRDYKISDLRNQFSIVLQDSVLLSVSVAENIGYGRDGATLAEIVKAAKMANAHEFILRLSDGYDTMVGERGMLLSGGERQRIALARAFLKDAPILILDEPTSSVDVKTEGVILDALKRLMRGRTTFIIAHRLNTLDECDLRLEVVAGRLTPSILRA